jgi:hypothetical protein
VHWFLSDKPLLSALSKPDSVGHTDKGPGYSTPCSTRFAVVLIGSMKLVQLCLVIGQAMWWAPDPCWAIGFWANWFLGGHPVKRSGKLIDKPAQQHLRALLMHQLRVMRPSTRLQLGFQENLNIVDTTIDELRGGMQTGNQTYYAIY